MEDNAMETTEAPGDMSLTFHSTSSIVDEGGEVYCTGMNRKRTNIANPLVAIHTCEARTYFSTITERDLVLSSSKPYGLRPVLPPLKSLLSVARVDLDSRYLLQSTMTTYGGHELDKTTETTPKAAANSLGVIFQARRFWHHMQDPVHSPPPNFSDYIFLVYVLENPCLNITQNCI
ncbi:hypothetical protein BD410DRAFT_831288 [Rickenella mellea]|uniref:Uncharacterized protein n=1 Tax=Rickenella mellea TaxID=50990 RepID=A0A4Y7PQT0_9AGAM|nr:hypothetical protein BD410DRAFT_831288 [Rickenella mellea]